LKFRKDVEPATLDMQFAQHAAAALIENCIQHGLSSKVEGGSITLRASCVGGRLHLWSRNDGSEIPDRRWRHCSTGASAVQQRERAVEGVVRSDYRMDIDSRPDRARGIENRSS